MNKQQADEMDFNITTRGREAILEIFEIRNNCYYFKAGDQDMTDPILREVILKHKPLMLKIMKEHKQRNNEKEN